MKATTIQAIFGFALISILVHCEKNDRPWQLESPDGRVRIEVSRQKLMSSERLFYSVLVREDGTWKALTDPSPLGIEREDTRFIDNMEFQSAEREDGIEDTYSLATGKQLECHSVYNRMILHFRNQEQHRVSLDLRAYDDGIAFRYHFPGESSSDVRVVNEITGFDFREGNFWGHPYDTITMWTPAYETCFTGPLAVGTPAPADKNGWAFPILVESEGWWMLVSEAGFDGSYGASHLSEDCRDGRYMIRFAEPGEAEGYYENTSHSSLPWYTPWRFIALGRSPDRIVETTLPTDLAPPQAMDDVSWIRPGRASWSWWSDSDSPQDYDRLVPFVDFAADMGWEYSLVDANWNRMQNGDIKKLAAYAEHKGVGLLLWYNSGGKHNRVTEEPRDLMEQRKTRAKEFERISGLGIKGIKVDFFQSDKQEIIRQYLEILEDAARYHLLVNFHGCTLPRGWRRTWPNLVTMESVRGGESYKFDARFPEMAPAHLTIVPFTRNAVGPVDYTTGGFSDHRYPHLTTFGFEMALPVLLESGIMHHMDTPEMTLGLPPFAVQFFREIPVAWDETRYIAGYPGKDAVIARRKGERWYMAGINGEAREKEMVLDLSKTGDLPGEIRLITDGDSSRELRLERVETGDGMVTIHMKPYGGFAGYW